MDILQNLLDTSSHAIFTMDRQGTVTHINRQAKERFGLFNHSRDSHPAGRLQPGDMVILATTAMGMDDGGLTPEDLRCIGIRDAKLRRGDMLAAIGVYMEEGVKPIYKHLRAGSGDALQLSATFQGVPVSITIENKEVVVEVRGKSYGITYFMYIGQMVVLDRYTRRVKFWEEKGYSARKEGIGDLLRRGSFIAKSFDTEIVVVGYHFREFFEGEKFEAHLRDILTGRIAAYEDQEYDINGYALSASLLPITGEGGAVEGVIVKFRSIADIRVTIMERNEAIRSAERRYRESERTVSGEDPFGGLLGNGPMMANVRQYARKLAQMDCPVLICGESGTGKRRVALAITQLQKRGGPVEVLDCAALPPEKLALALTGEGGAMARARDGTLVLRGIARMPMELQYQLLESLREENPGNVRLIAITSVDLKAEIAAGRFLPDLYYRLSAFCVELSPLRACREDIPLLANDLLDKLRLKYAAPERVLSGEAMGMLMSYDWPGNVQELENVLESAVALADGDIIYPEHIHLQTIPVRHTLREQLRETEKRIIRQTLAQCGGDRKAAMEQLGVSRSVFYDKLKEYNIK